MAQDAPRSGFQFTRPRGARHLLSFHFLQPHSVSIHAPTGGATKAVLRAPWEQPVSIHAPTGGATGGRPPPRNQKKVSIHAPTGGATAGSLGGRFRREVSIHAPTGGATGRPTKSSPNTAFQFTRPRGARPTSPPTPNRSRRFNSRAHGGRDPERHSVRRGRRVSIHAPTGGATKSLCKWFNIGGFNSRAHGGRDGARKTALPTGVLFQFTRPRGARPGSLGGRFRREVSIHAPTGGATPLLGLDTYGASSFNSRAHGGRDSAASHVPHALARFNSRAHGGRDTPFWANPRRKTFQFTRPRGARRLLAVLPCHFVVSIHAPTGGATLRGAPCDKVLRVSIHAPTGGATLADGLPHGRRRFNSRAHGGRDSSARSARASSLFQFTRPRGARQKINYYVIGGQYVSIHAPTGGATPSAKKCLRGKRFQFTRPRGARLSAPVYAFA